MSTYEKLKNLSDAEFLSHYKRHARIHDAVSIVLTTLAAAAWLHISGFSTKSISTVVGPLLVAMVAAVAVSFLLRVCVRKSGGFSHYAPVLGNKKARERLLKVASSCPAADAVRRYAVDHGRQLYAVDLDEMERRYRANRAARLVAEHPTSGEYRYAGPLSNTYEALSGLTNAEVYRLHKRRVCAHLALMATLLAVFVAGGALVVAEESAWGLVPILGCIVSGEYLGAYLAKAESTPYVEVTHSAKTKEFFTSALKEHPAMRQLRDDIVAKGRPVYVFDVTEALRRVAEDERAVLLAPRRL